MSAQELVHPDGPTGFPRGAEALLEASTAGVQAWISDWVTPCPSTVSHFFCLAELLNNFFL